MTNRIRTVLAFIVIFMLASCSSPSATNSTSQSNNPVKGSDEIKLTLGAYSTPREAYKEIIPLFEKDWEQKTGQKVTFDESYLGSGAQSRAIVQGFEADIAALSLEADINAITKAGLIKHDWKTLPHNGMVSDSIVAFAVRPGNPKGIHDWADLAKPGLQILTPNPKTSGGAMWNILALYGAAKRGFVEGVPANNDQAAQTFMLNVLKNVTVMDKDARGSITNFEKGIGDVAITYENEILVGKQNGEKYDLVIPRSTILIENPVAVVDTYVDKHNTRQAAEAFVQFLFSKQAQEIFAKYGLRSPDPEVAKATASQYPAVQDLFTIDYFGGWNKATPDFFSEQGIYSQVIAKVQGSNQ